MKKAIKRGLLIIFEGLDKSGKTTLAKKLVKKMGSKTIYQKGLCSPTLIGSMTRLFPSTFLFFLELLYLNWKNNLELKKGINVVQDRSYVSVAAYLPIANRIYNRLIIKLARTVLPPPDRLIYCFASDNQRLERLKNDLTKQHQQIIHQIEYIKLRKVFYQKFFKDFSGQKIIVNTSLSSVDECVNRVYKFLAQKK